MASGNAHGAPPARKPPPDSTTEPPVLEMPVHHPRSCPQIRAFAVTAEAAGHGTIPLASRLRYVISQRKNFRKFIEKPREFIDIYGNLRKFDIRGRSDRRFHDTGTRRSRADRNCGQMRGNALVENGAGLPGEGPPKSGPTPQATPERPVSRHRNCGQMRPPRRVRRRKKRGPTGGLSSIPHRRENPATVIAGKRV